MIAHVPIMVVDILQKCLSHGRVCGLFKATERRMGQLRKKRRNSQSETGYVANKSGDFTGNLPGGAHTEDTKIAK